MSTTVETVVWLDRFVAQFQMGDTFPCVNVMDYATRSDRWHQSETGVEGEVDESARQSKCVNYDPSTYPVEHQEILAFIQESLEAYLTALPEANSFPEFTIREQYSIHKYEPGDAYHAVHSDYSPLGMLATRHLSFLLYLNSVEDGGETEFVQQGVLVRPVEGRLLIFPSGWTHAHRSLTATTDRWVMNGWWGFV